MPYSYLLDTNILSDLIKHPTGKIFAKIQAVEENAICTSIIIACELKFGAVKKGSSRLIDRVDLILECIPILSLMPAVEKDYANIRTALEQAGTPIGGNDLLIAAHALHLNLTVVTNNIREFSLVPNLKFEDWLE